MLPHLPKFRPPRKRAEPRKPHSFNSNIRIYKYTPSQHFGLSRSLTLECCQSYFFRPHYDDSVKDAITGAKSEWTLLVYLTGVEDGVEGGQVRVSLFSTNFTYEPRLCSTKTKHAIRGTQ